ncbi:hypothetical protein FACS1894152_5620 [Bacilli bacterium]|nr:hypothetical protein FACS1894152_5620 [Bacilli bacterium]
MSEDGKKLEHQTMEQIEREYNQKRQDIEQKRQKLAQEYELERQKLGKGQILQPQQQQTTVVKALKRSASSDDIPRPASSILGFKNQNRSKNGYNEI